MSGHVHLNLQDGIRVACDDVFYEIGKAFYFGGRTQGGTISDTALQEEIAKFGFGQATGVDLSGEEPGAFPRRNGKPSTGPTFPPRVSGEAAT